MATFNVTVNLDWLDEEENLDGRLRDEILSGIVAKVGTNITNSLESEARKLLDAKMASLENEIGEKLNAMMQEFFDTPKDITDRWGGCCKAWCNRSGAVEGVLRSIPGSKSRQFWKARLRIWLL